jgi:hypothetical protein
MLTNHVHSLTGTSVSQAWQKKACIAPVRDTGPLTRRIGTALIIISFLLVLLRFIARWRMQNASIGADDWVILVAWLGLVPSTALVQISGFRLSKIPLTILIRRSQ